MKKRSERAAKLTISGPWEDAVRQALSRQRPAAGWPEKSPQASAAKKRPADKAAKKGSRAKK